MIMLGSFLLGFIMSSSYNALERHLIKDYEEIKVLKQWPFYIIAFLVGGLFTAVYNIYGNHFESLMYMSGVLVLMFLAYFDMRYMLLPTKVIHIGFVIGCLFCIVQSILRQNPIFLISSVLGAFIGYITFYLIFYGSIWILKKEGLGFGDVRLMGLIGLYIGIESIPIMLIISSLLAALVGVVLLGLKGKSEAFPFGPSLCTGALIMILFGNPIVDFYLKCMQL